MREGRTFGTTPDLPGLMLPAPPIPRLSIISLPLEESQSPYLAYFAYSGCSAMPVGCNMNSASCVPQADAFCGRLLASRLRMQRIIIIRRLRPTHVRPTTATSCSLWCSLRWPCGLYGPWPLRLQSDIALKRVLEEPWTALAGGLLLDWTHSRQRAAANQLSETAAAGESRLQYFKPCLRLALRTTSSRETNDLADAIKPADTCTCLRGMRVSGC